MKPTIVITENEIDEYYEVLLPDGSTRRYPTLEGAAGAAWDWPGAAIVRLDTDNDDVWETYMAWTARRREDDRIGAQLLAATARLGGPRRSMVTGRYKGGL